jgi:hypothetical protein
MHRHLETEAGFARPSPPVFDVSGESPLTRVDVYGCDPLANVHQSDGDMHGRRGFARSALFVAKHDNVR